MEHSLYTFPTVYDVVVIGAGHAGIEAAMASARLGCRTLMLTQNLDTIGQMSCNPAVGGLAKGHMVREIDALGGFMGINADATAVQCRMLNARKGPSVRAPRSQCDKKAYQFRAKAECERQPNLQVKQGNAVRIVVEDGVVTGVATNMGVLYSGRALVITTGTFMRGLLHVGMNSQPGGRMGDSPSSLSDSLLELGFEVARFKTGTPCRLLGRSIDFSKCLRQGGDEPPPQFSFDHTAFHLKARGDIFTLNSVLNGKFHVEQLPCWITHTNPATHDIIARNLDKSPLFSGRISSVGPRYCPSIEDKVVKFVEKSQHQLFLEPEGRHTDEYYVNGVSTSLPYEVQYKFIQTVAGLERAEIMRAGYAVEYDYCPPTQLKPTLETKNISGLYFAGQINGTSGYEEAGAQGLIAGANAALKLLDRQELVLGRSQAYIGVMIDDLVTKGTTEPYRMFTSRAEYRLLLRQDNADVRLTGLAHERGLVSTARWQAAQEKLRAIAAARQFAANTPVGAIRLQQWLKRTENSAETLPEEVRKKFCDEVWLAVETDLKYEGYITRQEDAIARSRATENRSLPVTTDYLGIPGLRMEARQKLTKIRPVTFGQAARISGITPADLSTISVWLKKPLPMSADGESSAHKDCRVLPPTSPIKEVG